LQVRPVLSNGYVAALLSTGSIEGVDRHLRNAERWLNEPAGPGVGAEMPAGQMVVADEAELRRLPAGLAVHRAGLALVLGDLPGTVHHAQRALQLFDEDDDVGRGAATALIGLASWTSGDLEAAHAAYAECTARLHRAGHQSDVLGCSITLADLRITQGRLRDAMRTYENALHVAQDQAGQVLRGTPDMYVGMAALHREHNDLGLARQLLEQAEELGEHMGLPQNRHRWRIAMARLHVAEGDLDGALELLEEAERVYTPDFSPPVRPIPAIRARVLLAQGSLAEARSWVQERGLSAADELSYLQEFEHITLARVLLTQQATARDERALEETIDLLERLLLAAEQGGRTGTAIEILVLQALAEQLRGDVPAGLPPLERALSLAEPEGYVRMFVDEGLAMASLLRAAEQDGIAPDYVRRLQDALSGTDPRTQTREDLVDPLSQRELDVLRLLGTDLGGPDIARELVLSLNTVRTHTNHIYAKLGVNNRRAAVRRAAELHLLGKPNERRPSGRR
jgi:LuxR family maltose regulon positive regulatory protein